MAPTVAHHALLVNARGVFTVMGSKVHGPVGSCDELLELLEEVRDEQRLTPCNASPQVWICGDEAAQALGWWLNYDDPAVMDVLGEEDLSRSEMVFRAKGLLSAQITQELAVAGAAERGWEVGRGSGAEFRGGPMVPLKSRSRQGRRFMVQVIVEPYLWTLTAREDYGIAGSAMAGTLLPEDDRAATAELARRLRWMTTHLGVLPSLTAAGTGATLLDVIFKARKKSGKGAVVADPTPWPATVDSTIPVEQELLWTRRPSAEEITQARWMVTVDQRASYLASAGSQDFGWGRTRRLDRDAVEALLQSCPESKVPFGLWHVTLPAAAEVFIDQRMPMPVPEMQALASAQTWMTTESLMVLIAPVVDGGAGISMLDLDIDEAYVYEHQGRILEAWAKVLREARAAAIADGDDAAKALVGSIYKGYVGRLVNEESWSSSYKKHHFQPMWRYAIIAGARRRGRRQAARIAARTGLYPIGAHTDSWTYLCATEEQIEALTDSSTALGRLVVEKVVEVTDEVRAKLAGEDTGVAVHGE